MFDPAVAAVSALFASALATAATFTDRFGVETSIRTIRSRGTADGRLGAGTIVMGGDTFDIRRSDIEDPRGGMVTLFQFDAAAGIEREVQFTIEGEPTLDVESLTWTCAALAVEL